MYINLQYYICILYININFIFTIEHLNKYSSIDISCNTKEFITFDSSIFKIPSTLYFKLSTNSSLQREIRYEFNDTKDMTDNNIYLENLRYVHNPSKETTENYNNEIIIIKYYNIEKNKAHISEGTGNRLILQLNCNGIIKIENIKNDVTSKKISTGTIIGIICGCVGAIALIIAIICYYAKYLEKRNKGGNGKRKLNRYKTQKNMSNLKLKKKSEIYRRRKSAMNPIVLSKHRINRNLINGNGLASSDSTIPIKGLKKI